jgi:hypothetical protein
MKQRYSQIRIPALVTAIALTACAHAVGGDDDVAEATGHDTQEEASAEAPRIEPRLIQQAIRSQYFASARACYEDALREDAQAGGKVNLRFVIRQGAAEEIEVEIAEGQFAGDAFAPCMRDALLEVSFPVADGDVTVNYPVVFSDD